MFDMSKKRTIPAPTFDDYVAALGDKLTTEEIKQMMKLHQRLADILVDQWFEHQERRRRAS